MMSSSGGLHSMLLSTQQILVCFLLLPNLSARRQSRIWSAACLGLVSAESSNVSILPIWRQVYVAMHIQWG